MMVLWLRFLTEIDANTQEVSSDLLSDPAISKALEEVKVSAFNEEELLPSQLATINYSRKVTSSTPMATCQVFDGTLG